ncbi:hypothetical protein LK994_11275 [Ferruginibacter lapsinanis]|uniref:SGNH/GDSL hydrolase family protein n=1 Tax=Ferruginibacter lapsinanis TaxID=563172 RepID=UPI001E3E5B7E|nr:hypothetical protein [Ferruginibacter lapsinanis]UEG49211.1 hypothetical protein LK994_11275 [Ferruginibacter lapsinanis]
MKKQTFINRILISSGLILLVCFFVACSNKKTPAVVHNRIDSSKIGKIKTVLILGNSIVRLPPDPAVEWYGDWGMAASTKDSDFVHLLIRNINLKDSTVVVHFKNISDFERNFTSYNFSKLDSLKNPDLLILKISENVDVKKAEDSNFIAHYDKLINYVDPNKKAERVIADGFWPKGYKYTRYHLWTVEGGDVNDMIRQYAIKNNYPFITTTNLSQDSTNMAGKRFKDASVASHPSDKGMRMIADLIWDYIKNYF